MKTIKETREIEIYQCEVCGFKYKDHKDCYICERQHKVGNCPHVEDDRDYFLKDIQLIPHSDGSSSGADIRFNCLRCGGKGFSHSYLEPQEYLDRFQQFLKKVIKTVPKVYR